MRPLIEGGETSETYIGESNETPPTARPPRKRAVIKKTKSGAKAVASDVAANRKATSTSSFLRPKRFVSLPAKKHPSTQPNSNELNAQPRPRSLKENALERKGPAPVMMAMSNPNNKPPKAAVHPRKTT